MNDAALRQLDAFTTPGTMLRAAREDAGMSEREAADRLNLMPDYVGILERDDYQALRSPAFARGYVRSYARMLGMEEAEVLRLFDEQQSEDVAGPKRVETRPLQLQRTGVGVIVGLAVLLVLMLLLWWWQGAEGDASALAPANEHGVACLATAFFQMVA